MRPASFRRRRRSALRVGEFVQFGWARYSELGLPEYNLRLIQDVIMREIGQQGAGDQGEVMRS